MILVGRGFVQVTFSVRSLRWILPIFSQGTIHSLSHFPNSFVFASICILYKSLLSQFYCQVFNMLIYDVFKMRSSNVIVVSERCVLLIPLLFIRGCSWLFISTCAFLCEVMKQQERAGQLTILNIITKFKILFIPRALIWNSFIRTLSSGFAATPWFRCTIHTDGLEVQVKESGFLCNASSSKVRLWPLCRFYFQKLYFQVF